MGKIPIVLRHFQIVCAIRYVRNLLYSAVTMMVSIIYASRRQIAYCSWMDVRCHTAFMRFWSQKYQKCFKVSLWQSHEISEAFVLLSWRDNKMKWVGKEQNRVGEIKFRKCKYSEKVPTIFTTNTLLELPRIELTATVIVIHCSNQFSYRDRRRWHYERKINTNVILLACIDINLKINLTIYTWKLSLQLS